MLTKPFPVEDQSDVTSADSVSLREFDLCDVSLQRSDFGCLLMGDASGSSMAESVFPMCSEGKVVDSNAGFGFAEMMDDHPVGDHSEDSFVSLSVSEFSIGCLSVSAGIDESLPDVTDSCESFFFLQPRLRQSPVVSEEITKWLACNPASSGMAPRSDGRGFSAPALAQAVAHNVEYTTVGGV